MEDIDEGLISFDLGLAWTCIARLTDDGLLGNNGLVHERTEKEVHVQGMGQTRLCMIVMAGLLLCGLIGTAAPLASAQGAPPNSDNVDVSTEWALAVDADGDGRPNPGNALRYTVRIQNRTDSNVWNATLTTMLDPELQLMQGSVEVSEGEIASGNRPGDRRLVVEIRRIGPQKSLEVSFDAIIKSPLPESVNQVCSQSWFSFVINLDPKASDTACTPIARRVEKPIGGDPPIHGSVQVFPTPEGAVGHDLTGNGEIGETALRYRDLSTGRIVNTGLVASGQHADTDTHDGVIAFVGNNDEIRLYDTATGDVTDLGARGSHPVINDHLVAFESSGWVRYYDRTTGSLTDPRMPGQDPVVYGQRIVYSWGNPATIRYFDLRTGETVDTGVVGTHPAVYGNRVALVTRETDIQTDLNDSGYVDSVGVIRVYNLATEALTNTGAIGRYPMLWDGVVAFSTQESSVQTDLNGDGRHLGEVIRYYDVRTDEVVNTRHLGTEPDIYEANISFYRWERWNLDSQDVNGDGDVLDPVVDVHTISGSESHVSEAVDPVPSSPKETADASLDGFDRNRNGVIDDGELVTVVDEWTSGTLGNDRFLAVLDAWVNGTAVRGRSQAAPAATTAATPAISLASRPSGPITFQAQNASTQEIGVSIYTLSGDRVFRARSGGSQLSWRLRNDQGIPVANGVYLYRVTTVGPDGRVARSDVRRLTVMR